MRVEVTPRRLSAVPGQPAVVTIGVSNNGTVISGHRIRVLGVDPQWASLDQQELSLFPDSSGVAVLTVNLPPGVPAGARTLSIEVTELTPPGEVAVVDVEVTVPAEPGLKLSVDPTSVTGGKNATVAVLVENTGNSDLDVDLAGADEEGALNFAFTPLDPALAPGEQIICSAKLDAKRPWFGSPKIRPFTVEAGPRSAPVIAYGAWVQKARLTRAALALIGLLTAATVFAVVLTASLSQVVGQSAADRNLAIQVAQAAGQTSTGGTSGISGTVSLLTSSKPVAGVSVDLYQSSNPAQPIVSTATGSTGGYHFSGLASGSYLVEFQGAGFSELWYPDSLTSTNAQAVTLATGQVQSGVNVRLGGLPATVEGQISGGDAEGATLTVEIPPATPGGVPTIVTTETLDATGKFDLTGIPSPAVYELVVTKPGYAPASQEIDLSGGETAGNISITLHQGNGSISGTVSTLKGPLGGATISASDGTTTVSTVSLTTTGNVGKFVLDDLPTPDTLTVVVSANGYATQTLSLSLSSNQQLTGVAVTLQSGEGSIAGEVTTASGPAGGVTVTATNGDVTLSTVTLSTGKVGTYTLSGLPVPGDFTVTFSSPDLASQTRAIDLPATGNTDITGVDADLVPNTAAVYGTVTQTGGQALGEVTVLLSSGSTSYTVTSATVPTLGSYEIDGVTPGTYTISFTRQGGQPTSSIVTLSAGQRYHYDPVLNPAASIDGCLVEERTAGQTTTTTGGTDTTTTDQTTTTEEKVPVPDAQVNLYLSTQFPTVVDETTLTDSSGCFSFENVDAPQSFIVAFAYPEGAANQLTVSVLTSLGQETDVCESNVTSQGGTTATGKCDYTTDQIEVSTS